MKTIKAKIIVLILSITILLCGILGVMNVLLNTQTADAVLEKNMLEIAKVASVRIQKELEITKQVAIELGRISQLSDPEVPVETKDMIIKGVIKNNGYIGGNLVGLDGVSILDGADIYKDRDYFLAGKQGKPFISGPTVSRITGEYSVMIAAPVWKNGQDGGEVAAVVYLKPDVKMFSEIVSTIQVGETGGAYIIDKTGLVMAHTDESRVFKYNAHELSKEDKSLVNMAAIEADMMAGNIGFQSDTQNGATWVQAYAPIEGTDGWSMGVYAQKNEFMGSVNTASMLTVFISVASVVIGIVVSLLFAASVLRPVKVAAAHLTKMANGEALESLDEKKFQGEFRPIAQSYNAMRQTLELLLADTGMLADNAVKGNFDVRADAAQHKGQYRDIVDGINQTLSTVVDKVVWYEALLDAVPLPLSVTDMEMNWTFINKPVENMLGVKRKNMLGMQCSNWNANICNTEKCGIARLRSGNLQTFFEQQGMNFQVDTSYILNAKGEKIGHIEVVQDITARSRASIYLKEEVEKIACALSELSEGNLSLEYSVGEGDQYTKVERESLLAIGNSLGSAVSTLRGYIGQISGMLQGMAGGDFSMNEVEAFKGDFAGISDSLNVIIDSFNGIFAEINTSAEQVAAGTQQVSGGAQALSQGATEQASAIEQLTVSLNDIAEQTKKNAANANQASELTFNAKEEAVEGNARMNELQQAMKEINEASANISKIIKVIDDIAFQTNLLALNAAVEAARAGQHGKGFAVVAEEVRNLAQRSAKAANETTGMIEESINRVKAGTKIANETADALGRIVKGVEKATELVGGIARASSDQATAVAQVNTGVSQVSQVTQTNSATAEESAAASEELSSQAVMLKEMVGKFTLKGQTYVQASRPAGFIAAANPTQPQENRSAQKVKIVLNETEFGKY